MDGNPPPPTVKTVRRYRKQPPPLVIPSLESIRALGTSSSSSSPIAAPSPSSASTSSTLTPLRAPKRSVWGKMNDVLRTYGFEGVGQFLSVLFHRRVRGEKDLRSRRHRQAVAAFLQGRSKITMAHILPLIYNHHKSRPKKADTTSASLAFSPSTPLADIRHARPCISAWATRLVGDHLYYRVGKLAHKTRTGGRSRRHLRATTNSRTNNPQVVEWEDVELSMEELANLYKEEDEFLWYITECAAASRKNGKAVVKKTRPHPIIQVGAISSFITSRNQYASGDLGLPLGLWLFACQAHVDIKRVFCRSGYAVSDSTARNALDTLTDSSLNDLKDQVREATAQGEVKFGKVSDNIQRYDKVYEHGLGRQNVMKHGTACTAFQLDNCKPGAFHAADHIARIVKQERQTMTAESIFNSIDWEHIDNTTDLHYVPLAKHRIEPKKKILQPLSTNAEQQIENKGYQADFFDFDEQMGIEPDKCDNLLSWNRGDGATHGALKRIQKIQATISNIYHSFRNAISTPETWHTKATSLTVYWDAR
ncbi:hypothetical protein DFH06DRAFT_999278 [Mycena polygramma]|nr:hypothetical protein DFH06DRAFT_999278 [Mycena polygramma]